MPIFNGSMYAEGKPLLHSFEELNVLLLGDISLDLQGFINHLDTLHYYLVDTVRSSIKIKLHCTALVADDLASRLGVERQDIVISTEQGLLDAVNRLDIDVVYDPNDQYEDKFLWSKFYEFEAQRTISDLQSSIENYLVGSGVAWSFAMPVWNMPLFMKYMSIPGLCMDYFAFMGECTSKGYSDAQKERVRYVMNKIKQVEYSRDILHYYIKRMRRARRSGMYDDDYNLQLNYHISNYYFLMAGTMDSLARLINSVYKLDLTAYRDLAVEKDSFIDKNRQMRTGFMRIFKNRKFKKWVLFLKERRNFIAHDGDMRQTPIVRENETPLTDAEIGAIVDRELDWAFLASVLPAEMYQAQRDQSVQLARIQNDYRVVAEKVMLIPNVGGHKIYSPLIDIDHDYEQFVDVMSKVLLRLSK